MATDSFQVQVFTEKENQVLFAKSGLTVTVDCDYPCLTCMANATNKCLTCDTESEFGLYLNNQCITKCPSNYFSQEYLCKRCDPNCWECADGGTKCTKCYKGTYLQGNTCVKQCRVGVEFQNEAASTCDSCKPPCATCSKSTDVCDSCM